MKHKDLEEQGVVAVPYGKMIMPYGYMVSTTEISNLIINEKALVELVASNIDKEKLETIISELYQKLEEENYNPWYIFEQISAKIISDLSSMGIDK